MTYAPGASGRAPLSLASCQRGFHDFRNDEAGRMLGIVPRLPPRFRPDSPAGKQ
jgi:hypothetical protein